MKSDILVVDDSDAVQILLQRVLRQTKMSIGTIYKAAGGAEALTLLSAHKIDLILLDLKMPKMNGFELLALLKASDQWRHIPVVMVTVEGAQSEVAEARRLGAAGYFRKPIMANQIEEALAGILGLNLQAA